MTEEERQLGELCETLFSHPSLPIEGDTTAESIKLLLEQYRIALHDAIIRPKGVVPESAEELYDQNYYDNLA